MSGNIQKFHVDGPTGPFEVFDGPPPSTVSGPRTFQYHNGHGDMAATANQGGTRTDSYTSRPFGEPDEALPANRLVERYVGRWHKQLDTKTDLILMGVRPYDPSVGRFLSIDPVDGGSANGYDYAAQDPVNEHDLDGDCLTCVVWGGRAIVAWAAKKFGASTARRYVSRSAPRRGPIRGYARHGLENAIARDGHGVNPRYVLDAVRNPVKVTKQSGGRRRYQGTDAIVVLNEKRRVITTWPLTVRAYRCHICGG